MILVARPGSDVLTPVESMTFAEAQAVVEGYVEVLWLVENEACALVNEEGRLRSMPFNGAASYVAGRPLVGPAVFLTDEHVDLVLGRRDDAEAS